MNRVARLAIVLVAPLLLLGCLLTPGKFTSSLDIARDGKFAFKYQGEIILLTNKSVMDQMGSEPEFTASCRDDEGADRECSEAEVAEQRRAHDEEKAAQKQREAKESAEMAAALGGIDPNNEATMDEFAARLQREVGWKKVVHRGGGVFDVDYEIAGNLDRDFLFPIFPRFDFIVPIVTVTRRDDNAILVRAPALGSSGSSGGGSGPMSGGGSKAEGVFTLTTGAAVATNNSEEGPMSEGGKQRIEWRVTPLNRTAPEALLRP